MFDGDWDSHRKHRQQIIADQDEYVGLYSEDMEPICDLDVIDHSAPETRHESSSLSMTVRARSPRGVIHQVANELVADFTVDRLGELVPVYNATRFILMERAGETPETRRVFRVWKTRASTDGPSPAVLPIEGVDLLDLLAGIVCPSIPESWTGQWIQADRDWAGPWSKTREIQDVRFAAVADGYTSSGPAEQTVRDLIIMSLDTAFRAIGKHVDPPIVVDRRPTGRPSENVMIRRTDDYILPTVQATAVAAGVNIRARMWLPGDTWKPYGVNVSKPTVVVFVEQSEEVA